MLGNATETNLVMATLSGSYQAVVSTLPSPCAADSDLMTVLKQQILETSSIEDLKATNFISNSFITSIYHDRLAIADLIASVSEMDLNFPTVDGNTPLIFAAMWGKLDMAKYLLEKGVDVTLTNKKGETALALARMNGHQDVVLLLRNFGARA